MKSIFRLVILFFTCLIAVLASPSAQNATTFPDAEDFVGAEHILLNYLDQWISKINRTKNSLDQDQEQSAAAAIANQCFDLMRMLLEVGKNRNLFALRGAEHNSASSNSINSLNNFRYHSSVTPAPESAQLLRTISVPEASNKRLRSPAATATESTASPSTTSASQEDTSTGFSTTLVYSSESPSRAPVYRSASQARRRVPVRKVIPQNPLPAPSRAPLPIPPIPPPFTRTTTTQATTTTTSSSTTSTEDPSSGIPDWRPDYDTDDDEDDNDESSGSTTRPRNEFTLRVSPLNDLTTIESLRKRPTPPKSTPSPKKAEPLYFIEDLSSTTSRRPPARSPRLVPRRVLVTSARVPSSTTTTTTTSAPLPTTSAPTTERTVTKKSIGRATGVISRVRSKPSRLTVLNVPDLNTRPTAARRLEAVLTAKPTVATQAPDTLRSSTSTTPSPSTTTSRRTTPAPTPTTGSEIVRNYRSNTTTSKAPEFSEEELTSLTVPGVPAVDYPVYRDIPLTTFDCRSIEYPGFYADLDTGCQVYHSCGARGRRHSFLCPNGTIFSQEYLICDWWYNVQCTESPNHYQLNKDAFSSPSTNSREQTSPADNESNINDSNNNNNSSEERVVVIRVRNLSANNHNNTIAPGENDELSSSASSSSSSSSSYSSPLSPPSTSSA